jgi:hypothetical protein
MADDESEMMSKINPKPTSANVLNLIKSNEFWENLGNLVKADDAPLALNYHYFGELYKIRLNPVKLSQK